MRRAILATVLALGLLPLAAHAAGKPYEVKTGATPAKAGEKGKVSIQIVAGTGAHVSADAPLKITLKSEGLKLEKATLAHADAVEGKGQSPRFEVPFVAEKKGEQSVDADMTFFVCTAQLCSRHVEKVTIPVVVQ